MLLSFLQILYVSLVSHYTVSYLSLYIFISRLLLSPLLCLCLCLSLFLFLSLSVGLSLSLSTPNSSEVYRWQNRTSEKLMLQISMLANWTPPSFEFLETLSNSSWNQFLDCLIRSSSITNKSTLS